MSPDLSSKAAVCRALAQTPDAARMPLAAPLSSVAMRGPVAPDDVAETLVAYLLDREPGALVACTKPFERWLDGPLFAWVGPGNAVMIDDVIAALIAGPMLGDGDRLSNKLLDNRFAPRAGEAVALAVASLYDDAQPRALAQLFADRGPQPDLLALSLVQCGRVLAWSPKLLAQPIGKDVVDELLALLDPTRPRPLLDEVARALGPIASHGGELGVRVREVAFARLADGVTPEHHDLSSACAYILGFASPRDFDVYRGYRSLIVDRAGDQEIFVSFLEGLVKSAHTSAVSELVNGMVNGEDQQVLTALAIANALPLDPIEERLLAELEAEDPSRRAAATGAVEMLAGPEVDMALAKRLIDPVPEVAAAAARVLVARGRQDFLMAHTTRDMEPVRRCISLAGIGDLREQTIDVLARYVLGEVVIDAERETAAPTTASPLTLLIGDCLLHSTSGCELAAQLVGEMPAVASLLASAAAASAERDVAVVAPETVREQLALAIEGDGSDEGALGLYLLARFAAGDSELATRIAARLETRDRNELHFLAALRELRVANELTSGVLAQRVAPHRALETRIAAAAICGRALDVDHPAWGHVEDMLGLGPQARAAAWNALRDRARRNA